MKTNSRTKLLLSSIGGAVFALSAQGVLAQAVREANTATVTEEVVVTGVRRSLETALEIKRNATSIVEHISAEDIGSLPALDLGESLQAIPGVQLNVENDQRTSDINLRGLPGGYVLTTANGFGFATPSLSSSPRGASNPFGSFEGSIFRGITVIKTPRADMLDGAIAGYVEKKLPKALSGSKDSLSINVGTRYEQIADDFDPEISVRANKTIIDDVLAISGTYARSEQRFRRDSLNFTRYENFLDSFLDPASGFTSVNEYKESVGLGPNDNLLYASEVRQFSERAEGDRESYAFNVEWQATDNLKFGIDFLGTEKNLFNNAQDVFILGTRQSIGGVGVSDIIPNPDADPIFGFTVPATINENGVETAPAVDTYVVTDYFFSNAQYFPGNRNTDRFEKTDGVFVTAEWENDYWTISGGFSVSDAEASRINAQIDTRYQPADRRSDQTRTNGITGRLRTGNDNFLDDYLLEINGFQNLDLSEPFRYDLRASDDTPHEIFDRALTRTNLISTGTNDDLSLFNTRILVTSNEQFVQRENDSFKLDIERALETEFFDTVKAGVFSSSEKFASQFRFHTPAFTNIFNNAINNDLLGPAEFARGNDFYNGNLPGFAGVEGGWLAVDINATVNTLTQGVEEGYRENYQALVDSVTVEGGNAADDALTDDQKAQALAYYAEPEFTSLGFLRRRGGTSEAQDFESQVDIESVYIMTEFSADLGSVPMSGNFGVRYSKTENEALGLTFSPDDPAGVVEEFNDDGTLFRTYNVNDNRAINSGGDGGILYNDIYQVSNPKNSYENFLPSLNLSFELKEDLLLRAAYYEAISRPNVASFRPNGSVSVNDRTIRVQVADSELQPFEAKSADILLSWYNRAGSVISIGYFQKDVKGDTVNTTICPEDGGGLGFGALSLEGPVGAEICRADEFTNVDIRDDDGNVTGTESIQREVIVNQRVISEEEQTIKGFELVIQQNLDFLPEPFSYFGGQLSYTNATNDGARIQGISENAYNLITYFETDNFTTRLSYNYRDSYLLNQASSFTGFEDREVKPRGRLDLSLSYRFTKDLRLTFRAFNLLDEVYEEFQSGNENLPKRSNYDGRIYSLSANMKF